MSCESRFEQFSVFVDPAPVAVFASLSAPAWVSPLEPGRRRRRATRAASPRSHRPCRCVRFALCCVFGRWVFWFEAPLLIARCATLSSAFFSLVRVALARRWRYGSMFCARTGSVLYSCAAGAECGADGPERAAADGPRAPRRSQCVLSHFVFLSSFLALCSALLVATTCCWLLPSLSVEAACARVVILVFVVALSAIIEVWFLRVCPAVRPRTQGGAHGGPPGHRRAKTLGAVSQLPRQVGS